MNMHMLLVALLSLIGLFVFLRALTPALNSAFVPTPQDEGLRMETAQTKTASFVGTSLDLGAGFSAGGLGMPGAAVVDASAVDRTTGDETYAWTLEESSDNATFTACGPAVNITLAGVFSVPGFISKRYVRVHPVLGGTTPSVTYDAWLNLVVQR